jgi:hypothetical protein
MDNMKDCISLIIRKMKIKTTVRHHLTPVGMATIRKITSAGKDVEKGILAHCWWECILVVNIQQCVVEVLQKIKNRTTIESHKLTTGYKAKGNELSMSKKICTPLFTAALITAVQNWNLLSVH